MDYAILMAITGDYAFCAAHTLLTLQRSSPQVFERCDFIICQNGLTQASRRALQKICAGRAQFPQALTPQDSPWLQAECCRGLSVPAQYGMESLRGFALIRRYQRVLWLETDLEICQSLEALFKLPGDMAGQFGQRHGRGRGPVSHLLRNPGDDPCQFLQGGVIMFTQGLRRLHLTPAALAERAAAYGTHHPGTAVSLVEHFIPYLAYYYQLEITVIPQHFNVIIGSLDYPALAQAAIRHFATTACNKPWDAGHVLHFFPEFARSQAAFRELGGEGGPDPDALEEGLFRGEHAFHVLRSLEIFGAQIMGWSIMRDPQMEFDCFCTSGRLRFYFRGYERGLYLELFCRHIGWFEVNLCLSGELRTPRAEGCLEQLQAFLSRGVRWDAQIGLRSIARLVAPGGELRLMLVWKELEGTGEVLEILTLAVRTLFCLQLQDELQTRGGDSLTYPVTVHNRYNRAHDLHPACHNAPGLAAAA